MHGRFDVGTSRRPEETGGREKHPSVRSESPHALVSEGARSLTSYATARGEMSPRIVLRIPNGASAPRREMENHSRGARHGPRRQVGQRFLRLSYSAR